MKKIIFSLLSLSFFLIWPNFVSADVSANTTITADTTWSPTNGVYIIGSSFSVAPNVTLTIEPGTVIKAQTTSQSQPKIYGKMIAYGTAENPIYFTSFFDDALGGDTDGYGPTVGTPGDWQGLYFKPGSEGIFDYVELSYAGYGGYGYGDFVGIQNDGGTLNIDHSRIYDNNQTAASGSGIYQKSGFLSIANSKIENNVSGIMIDSGEAFISNNLIKNNFNRDGFSSSYGLSAGGAGKLTLSDNIFEGNRRTAFVSAAIDFTHEGNTSADQTRRGFEMSGVINDGAILHSRDLPLIIPSGVIVEAGKSASIAPGTILKFGNPQGTGSIRIYGDLIAHGTKDQKIYFTSLKDDAVGGDTGGDGGATTPAPKDWEGIYLESGSADLDNVVFRYGGYNFGSGIASTIYNLGAILKINNSEIGQSQNSILLQDGGQTEISNSEINGSNYGLWFRGGALNISKSSLLGPSYGLAVYNQSGEFGPSIQIDARNNWWGSSDGPNDIAVTPTGSGSKISGNILYTPFLTAWPPSTTPQINPVIIIPGIMGSAKKNGELLIDPILHTYDDLIATLEANGYQKDKNLFDFPYEWRDSNVITANLLKNKIAEVKTACEIAQGAGAISQALGQIDCSKVDIVAHSMGGLVAREYIQSGQYQNDIDQLIFLGTPHKGSPKAYLQWEGGEFPPDDQASILLKLKFDLEAKKNLYSSIFNYIQGRPISSVQELLPTFDYLKDKDTSVLRTYPNNYPRNIFLEALNTETGISKLINSGVKLTNITGNTGDNTIEKIRVIANSGPTWINGKPDGFDGQTIDRGLEKGEGDGTVTTFGSILDSSVQNEIWNGVSHQKLPRETSARIFNLLTNKTATDVIFLSPVEKIFSIQLQSPIDVVITAPDGKKMGKNFATGQEYDEIVGAFYSGFNNGDEEYITIPNPIDGDYKIEVQGTGDGGEYGVLTSLIAEATSTTNQIVGITEPNQITEINTKIDNQNQTITETERVITLEVFKNDINGAYDLGWIKDKKVRDSLIKQAKLIIKFEKKRNGKYEQKVDKILIRLLKKELDLLLRKDKINEQAYNLIKQDLEYLINNN